MTIDPSATSGDPGGDPSAVTWPIRPSMARVTTPAPLDLFASFRKRSPTSMNWLKAARAAAVWRARPGIAGLAIHLRLAGWPLRFLPEALHHLWKHGKLWQETFGRSRLDQFRDMVAAASHNALMPKDYYRCQMALLQRSGAFFELFPHQLYVTPLIVLSNPATASLVNNKRRLSAVLSSAGIATPAIFSVVADGELRDLSGSAARLPRRDFLVKPAAGLQGGGISIWRHGADDRWSCAGESLDEAALTSRLVRLSGTMRGGALVQEALTNHPSMAPIAPYALSTFRVVTVLDETRRPEVVICQFRSATDPSAVVDNYHAGGCLFAIDMETGRFGAGFQLDFAEHPRVIEDHPATGAPIAGQTVPGLEQACAMALDAHRLFPQVVCIGWDVAYTGRGHVILEGNAPPGIQPSQQIAVGDRARRRIIDLIGFHARQWLETTEPPGSRFLVGRDL